MSGALETPRPVRIALWSGPRNISTAMMRAFENRPDTAVWDEPFYAFYLRATGLDHPGAAEIVAAYETDWRAIARACAEGPVPGDKPVFFQKHMAGHLLDAVARDWLEAPRHVFLIRDPAAVVVSYAKTRGEVTPDDIGLARQVELFETIRRQRGRPPLVLDASDVLGQPEAALRALCAEVGIAFSPAMLRWPAGRRDSDGIWAPHWYANVEASTGFAADRPPDIAVPDRLAWVVEAARADYAHLAAHRPELVA